MPELTRALSHIETNPVFAYGVSFSLGNSYGEMI